MRSELHGLAGPLVVGLGGVALRLDGFLRNYALSLDEAALARNIIERPWTQLWGRLDYEQIAPPGFLIAERAIVRALGSSEYALRLFPLLCELLALWLCWILCRRLLSRVAALMAFTLFALNTSMIDYATRAKPYAGEVTAALLFLILATKVFEPGVTRRRAAWLAVCGGLTCLFSFANVFVLAAGAIVCVYRARREPAARGALFVAAAVWTVSAGSGALVATRNLSAADAANLQWFFQSAFMPLPPRSLSDLLWLGHQLKETFRWTAAYRASVVWIAAAALGVWSLRQRQQIETALLLLLPLILVVAASAAHKYPFMAGRAELFLMPLLFVLVAEGADWCRRVVPPRATWIGAAPIIVLLALSLQGTWSGWRIQRSGDLRSVFQYISNHWQPADGLFVHFTAAQQFFYYAPRLGLQAVDYTVASCSDDVQRKALWEIERYRGRPRVWIAVWATDQTELLFRYLAATATVRDAFSNDPQSSNEIPMANGAAILYDLSTPVTVTPRTFVAERLDSLENARTCNGVFRAFADPK